MPATRRFVRTLAIVLVCALNAYTVLATCGGGGGGGTGGVGMLGGGGGSGSSYALPWLLAGPEATSGPPGAELVLYWFPTSREQAMGSELLASRMLLSYTSRCLVFALVTSENEPLTRQFETTDSKPVAILAAGDDTVISRLERNGKGELKRKDVEKLVKTEYKAREDAVKAHLNDAKRLARSGDNDDAIALYQGVREQSCMFPKKANDAAKALRKLGVQVAAGNAPMVAMDVSEATNEQAEQLMQRGLQAEEAGDYTAAQASYEAVRQLDPADPVPLRYLGELYRHHTGNWDLAASVFEQILTMPADAVSRAVAQHGLGKMTIHGGEFEKGVAMIEASIETYPLALAYRNLAVYWNSEEEFDKAYGYAKKALELDPNDPYNIVFAATYLVRSGHREEALDIAAEHADLLSASYNLAAIHALAGDDEVALRLLRRHFYEYESNDAVRAKEMWEAREDFVFASLKDDARFAELTSLADQQVGMK